MKMTKENWTKRKTENLIKIANNHFSISFEFVMRVAYNGIVKKKKCRSILCIVFVGFVH